MGFLSLFKKVTSLILTHFKSIKILLFRFNVFVIKAWKLCKSIFACRFFLKPTKIREVKWLFTALFLNTFSRTIIEICLITKLREVNRFFIFILLRRLGINFFSLDNFFFRSCWIEWVSDYWKRWCIHWISLCTLNILKLIKIETLIRLSVFDRKLPTLIHLIHLFGIINLGFIFCHSFKRIFNRNIFGFILWNGNFFKRTLLAYRIIFLRLFWRFKLIFWCLEWIAWLFIGPRKILTGSLKRVLKRILSLALCETLIHFKI